MIMNPETYDKRCEKNAVEKYVNGMFQPFLKELFEDTENMKILDVGCGTSEFLKEARGFSVGIDNDINMINYGLKKIYGKNILLIKADMAEIPIKSGIFDKIFFIGSLEYSDPEKAIAEAGRLLKDHGYIEFVSWNKYNPLESRTCIGAGLKKREHLRKFSKNDIIRMMKKHGFSPERCTSFGIVTHYPKSMKIPPIWRFLEKAWKPLQSKIPLGLILHMSFRKTADK